mmetsp:Transcript_24570/g.65569  ORF Transcript_24570/g.65569 Transcript_24570/m.65569 type:complete len:373 (-) Transcript_24570:140-1258(-)
MAEAKSENTAVAVHQGGAAMVVALGFAISLFTHGRRRSKNAMIVILEPSLAGIVVALLTLAPVRVPHHFVLALFHLRQPDRARSEADFGPRRRLAHLLRLIALVRGEKYHPPADRELDGAAAHCELVESGGWIVSQRHLVPVVAEAFKQVVHADIGGSVAMLPTVEQKSRRPEVGAERENEVVCLAHQRQVRVHVVHGQGTLHPRLHHDVELVAVLRHELLERQRPVGADEEAVHAEEPPQPPRLVHIVLGREPLRLPVLVHAQPQVHADDGAPPPHARLLLLDEGPELRPRPVQVRRRLHPPPEEAGEARLGPGREVGEVGCEVGDVEEPLAVLDPPEVPRHAQVHDRGVEHVHAWQQTDAFGDVRRPSTD